MDKILAQSEWMTITSKANKVVEIDIEGIIGGSFWEEENEDSLNTKEKMRAELKAISAAKADTIIVNINSFGGSVTHGISIHDMLAQHSANIITRVNGFTASIATTIAMAGDTREMGSNSLFLVHKPMLMFMGNYNGNELKDRIADLNKVEDRLNAIYTKRGVDPDMLAELMEEQNGSGKWINAEEAQTFGFIDSIYEPQKMAAVVGDLSILKKMNITNLPSNYTDMTKTAEVKTLFDKFKAWAIENKLIAAPAEGTAPEETTPIIPAAATIMVAPAELAAHMTAMQTAIDGFEANEAAVAELATVNETLTATVGELDALKATSQTQAQKIIKLEAALTKKNAGSTETGGPEGVEDSENGGKTDKQIALDNDLAKLRGELETVHS